MNNDYLKKSEDNKHIYDQHEANITSRQEELDQARESMDKAIQLRDKQVRAHESVTGELRVSYVATAFQKLSEARDPDGALGDFKNYYLTGELKKRPIHASDKDYLTVLYKTRMDYSDKEHKKNVAAIEKQSVAKIQNAHKIQSARQELAKRQQRVQSDPITPEILTERLNQFNAIVYNDEFKHYKSDKDFADNFLEYSIRLDALLSQGHSILHYLNNRATEEELNANEDAFRNAMAKTATLEAMKEYSDERAHLLTNSYYINITSDMYKKLSGQEMRERMEIEATSPHVDAELLEFYAVASDMKLMATGLREDGSERRALQKAFSLQNWNDVKNRRKLLSANNWSQLADLEEEVKKTTEKYREAGFKLNKEKGELREKLDAFAKSKELERQKENEKKKKAEKEAGKTDWESKLKGEAGAELTEKQKELLKLLKDKNYEQKLEGRDGAASVIKLMEHRAESNEQYIETYIENRFAQYTAGIPALKEKLKTMLVKEMEEAGLAHKVFDSTSKNKKKGSSKAPNNLYDLLSSEKTAKKVKDEFGKYIKRNIKIKNEIFGFDSSVWGSLESSFYRTDEAAKLFEMSDEAFDVRLNEIRSNKEKNDDLIDRYLESRRLDDPSIDPEVMKSAVNKALGTRLALAPLSEIIIALENCISIKNFIQTKKGPAVVAGRAAAAGYKGFDGELNSVYANVISKILKVEDPSLYAIEATEMSSPGEALFAVLKNNPEILKKYSALEYMGSAEALESFTYMELEDMLGMLVSSIDRENLEKNLKEVMAMPGTGFKFNERRELKKRLIISALEGKNADRETVLNDIRQQAEEERLERQKRHRVLLYDCMNGQMEREYNILKGYQNIIKHTQTSTMCSADTLRSRYSAMTDSRMMWNKIMDSDFAYDVMEVMAAFDLKEGSKAFLKKLEARNPRSAAWVKALFFNRTFNGSKQKSFADFFDENKYEFALFGCDRGMMAAGSQGEKVFTEKRNSNYRRGLKEHSLLMSQRMKAAEAMVRSKYPIHSKDPLSEDDIRKRKLMRSALRILAGGLLEVKYTDENGLPVDPEIIRYTKLENRRRFGVDTFDEALSVFMNNAANAEDALQVSMEGEFCYHDNMLDAFRANEKAARENLKNTMGLEFTDQILHLKAVRQKLADISTSFLGQEATDQIKLFTDDIKERMEPLSKSIRDDANGLYLKYYCLHDPEDTLGRCFTEEGRTFDWSSHASMKASELNKRRTFSNKPVSVTQIMDKAYKSAEAYAASVTKKNRSFRRLMDTREIFKKGLLYGTTGFELILAESKITKEISEDIIKKYDERQELIRKAVEDIGNMNDLSQQEQELFGIYGDDIAASFIDSHWKLMFRSTEPDWTRLQEAIRGHAMENAEQIKKIDPEFVVISEKDVYGIIGEQEKLEAAEKDKDLKKILEMKRMVDNNSNIYLSWLEINAGLVQKKSYSGTEAEKQLNLVDKALKDMKHEGELSEGLRSFMAGVNYAGEKDLDLKRELVYLMGIYRGQLEYYKKIKPDMMKNDKAVQISDPEKMAEKAAIFIYLNVKKHRTDPGMDTIKKYAPTEEPVHVEDDGFVVVEMDETDVNLKYIRKGGKKTDKAAAGKAQAQNIPEGWETVKAPTIMESLRGPGFDSVRIKNRQEFEKLVKQSIDENKAKKGKSQALKDAKKKQKELEKNRKFEEKNPGYQIPVFSMGQAGKDYKDIPESVRDFMAASEKFEVMEKKYSTLMKKVGTFKSVPAVEEEYRDFIKSMQPAVYFMSPEEFDAAVTKREHFLKQMVTLHGIVMGKLHPAGEVAADEKLVKSFMDYFRSRVYEDCSGGNQLDANALADAVDALVWSQEKEDKVLSDLEELKKKTALTPAQEAEKKELEKKLRDLHNMKLEGHYLKGMQSEEKAESGYYFGQENQSSFEGLIYNSSNKEVKGSFEKLDKVERVLFAALMSLNDVTSQVNTGGFANVSEFKSLTSREEVENAIKAYFQGNEDAVKEALKKLKIDYDMAGNILLGGRSRPAANLEINEKAFMAAMSVMDAMRVKKQAANAPSLEKVGDVTISNDFAIEKGLRQGRYLKDLRDKKFSLKNKNVFLSKLKELVAEDLSHDNGQNVLKRAVNAGHNFYEGVKVSPLSERLLKMNQEDMKLFMLVMQDRTVLDYKSADREEAFKSGTQIDHVNGQKRDLIMSHFMASPEVSSKLLVPSLEDASLETVYKTLLSFQLRDDEAVDGNKITDFQDHSVTRSTLIDWELVKRAFDFMDEIKTEQKRLEIIRHSRDEEFIKAQSNEKAKNVYDEALKLRDKKTAKKEKGAFKKKQFIKILEKNTDTDDQVQMQMLSAFKRLTPPQVALFFKALKNRDVLDISMRNSTTNLLLGFEKNYVNSAGRYELIDEYVKRGANDMAGVERSDQDCFDAMCSLLTTQIDDSLDFKDMKAESISKYFVKERDTAIDWKLFANALQFVTRAEDEKNTFYQDRALYETIGDISKNGNFQFDNRFLRRNISTSYGSLATFTVNRVKTNLMKFLPETGNLRTLLSFVLNIETMNKVNKVLAKPGESGSTVNDGAEELKRQHKIEHLEKAASETDDKAEAKELKKQADALKTDGEKLAEDRNKPKEETNEDPEARKLAEAELALEKKRANEDQFNMPVNGKYLSGIQIETTLGLKEELGDFKSLIADSYGRMAKLKTVEPEKNEIVLTNNIKLKDKNNGNTIKLSLMENENKKRVFRLEMNTSVEIEKEAYDELKNSLKKLISDKEKNANSKTNKMTSKQMEKVAGSSNALNELTQVSQMFNILKDTLGTDDEMLKGIGDCLKQISDLSIQGKALSMTDENGENLLSKSDFAESFNIDSIVAMSVVVGDKFGKKEEMEKIQKYYLDLRKAKDSIASFVNKAVDKGALNALSASDFSTVFQVIMDVPYVANNETAVKVMKTAQVVTKKAPEVMAKLMDTFADKSRTLFGQSKGELQLEPGKHFDDFGIDIAIQGATDIMDALGASEKAKNITKDAGDLASHLSDIYHRVINDDYAHEILGDRISENKKLLEGATDSKNREELLDRIKGDEALLKEVEAAKVRGIAESIDIKTMGSLVSRFVSNPVYQERINDYSGLVNELKNTTASIYENFNKDMATDEKWASVSIENLIDVVKQVGKDSKAGKIITGALCAGQITGKAYAMYLKLAKDELKLNGKTFRAPGESKTKDSDGANRGFSDTMSQYGIDEVFSIIKLVGTACCSEKTAETLAVVEASRKEMMDNLEALVKRFKPSEEDANAIYGICLGATSVKAITDGCLKYFGDNSEAVQQIKKVEGAAMEIFKNVASWSDSKDVFENINDLSITGILDLTGAQEHGSVMNTVGKVLKNVQDIYKAGYGITYQYWGGASSVAGTVSYLSNKLSGASFEDSYQLELDATTEKIMKNFKDAPVIGNLLKDMDTKTLQNYIKGGKIVIQNIGNVYTLVNCAISEVRLLNERSNMNDRDEKDTQMVIAALLEDDKFLKSLGKGMKLSSGEISLVKSGLKENQFNTGLGMDYTEATIGDDTLKALFSIGGSVVKNTVDPTGLLKGIIEEAGAWINFFRRRITDQAAAEEYLILGPGKEYLADVIEDLSEYTDISEVSNGQLVEMTKQRMGFGLENDMAFRTFIGRKIAHSILFSASDYNPMEGIKLRSKLMLKILGLSDLIGKQDMESANKLYERLVGNFGINVSGLEPKIGLKTDLGGGLNVHDVYKFVKPANVKNKLKAG